ncbi:MAG: hypothetical protein AB7Q45_11280 [Planctomycetaceae bacterium]
MIHTDYLLQTNLATDLSAVTTAAVPEPLSAALFALGGARWRSGFPDGGGSASVAAASGGHTPHM